MTQQSGTNETVQGRILIVDDENFIRKSISLMIEWMGFEVRAAECGEKAVKLFTENTFDLVFTDFNMPGMDGAGLARCIKEISPTTPVVLITGDPKELAKKRPGGDSVDVAVPKPLMLNQIKEIIEKILG